MPGTDRLVLNGEVAVLVSPGFGSGWSTWCNDPSNVLNMLFDPQIADVFLSNEPREMQISKAQTIAELKYPNEWLGGLDQLEVLMVPEGTRFYIDEYDGAEIIVFEKDVKWIAA